MRERVHSTTDSSAAAALALCTPCEGAVRARVSARLEDEGERKVQQLQASRSTGNLKTKTELDSSEELGVVVASSQWN